MKILLISNMYPSNKYPSYGVFVKNFEDILSELEVNYDSVYLTKTTNRIWKLMKYFIYYFTMIYKIFLRKYDMVYVHYISHNSIPLIICKKIRKFNLWINTHGTDIIPQTNNQKYLQRYVEKIMPKAEKIIVPSKYYKNIVQNKFKINEQKIEIIPSGGVDKKIFYPKKSVEVLEKYKINNENKVIGYISRIDPNKGWDVFLQSVKELKEKNKLIGKNIIMVGSGSDDDKCTSMIQKLGLKEDIIRIPLVNQLELSFLYNALDVLCFPSFQESLGLVPLEAMSCGIPVISSDIGAVKEYLFNGVNGFMFEVGSPSELANKINDFFEIANDDIERMSRICINISMKYEKEVIKEELKKILSK